MMLKLFQITAEDREPMFVAARSSHRAGTIFVVYEDKAGRPITPFTVERVDNKLPAGLRFGLDDYLKHGSQGVVILALGWRAK